MIENTSIINNMKIINNNKYEVVKNETNEFNYKNTPLYNNYNNKNIMDYNINNNSYNNNINYSLLKAEEKISNDLLDEYYEENCWNLIRH